MSYQEKRSIASIVSIIIGFIVYGIYVFNKIDNGNVDLSEDLSYFGYYILLMIPVLIVIEIVVKIVFDIINRTEEKGEEPKHMDEFDKIIELKAIRNFSFVFLFGFFLAMLLLALSVSVQSVFIVLFISVILSGLALNISYIYYYRRGV